MLTTEQVEHFREYWFVTATEFFVAGEVEAMRAELSSLITLSRTQRNGTIQTLSVPVWPITFSTAIMWCARCRKMVFFSLSAKFNTV